jgi:23S rRNA (cytosine1962-C5)-methyltransferase
MTTAHRLYSSGEAWLERFGEDGLLSFQNERARDVVLGGLQEFLAGCGLKLRRLFARALPRQNEERVAPVLIDGDPAMPLETVVEEAGVRFGIDFGAGYAAGLFLDQRANRAALRRFNPVRLLNTFSYTCSFSVFGAIAGAQTTSVDLSRKSLERGRENFRLNGLQPEPESGHRFFAEDALELLPRLARKGELFDVVILDPPTFSRGNKGRRFQVERDLGDLLALALEVAAPHAKILLSTNCTRLNRRDLEQISRGVLKGARRGGDFRIEPDLPDIPPSLSARTLWVCMKA